jgi:hypothetical protein
MGSHLIQQALPKTRILALNKKSIMSRKNSQNAGNGTKKISTINHRSKSGLQINNGDSRNHSLHDI